MAVALLAALALVGTPGGAGAATTSPDGAGRSSGPDLVLLSQTPWVTPGQVFDLHLRADAPSVPATHLGVSVSVYSCLSSVSGFDQSLGAGPWAPRCRPPPPRWP